MRLGTTEIMLLVFLALILFGGGKISGVGKALGTSIRDFRREIRNIDEDGQKQPAQESSEKAV